MGRVKLIVFLSFLLVVGSMPSVFGRTVYDTEIAVWLQKVSAENFERCKKDGHAPDAEFAVAEGHEGDEYDLRLRLKIVPVRWQADGSYKTGPATDMTVLFGDLDPQNITIDLIYPPTKAKYPGYWAVTIGLPKGSERESIRMLFDNPKQAEIATKCWIALIYKCSSKQYEPIKEEPAPWRMCLRMDEAPLFPELVTLRNRLKKIIKERNIKALLDCLSPDILCDYGGGVGIETFKENWKLNNPETKLWDTLDEILNNGGAFLHSNNGYLKKTLRYANELDCDFSVWSGVNWDLDRQREVVFVAPFWFFAPGSGYEDVVVKKNRAPVREAPTADSKIVGTLPKKAVVGVAGQGWVFENHEPTWIEISENDIHGFVQAEHVRSIIDYRAGFKRNTKGEWKMNVLVAGD